ncbi:MAG: DegT/DnrJ/EryC1/StrS family aminotransferase [Sphingobacteriales bacterium]|nr:MAG: DegT/DnrJ/EryC1/StrS family aminotransferase [Sphingobacteriales bacterium]
MKIPFSPPYIDMDVILEVTESLQSGWITTGPKVKELEQMIATMTGVSNVLCVNSWTSGAILTMKWLGLGEGDEVIVPAYTYAATALSVMHAGATPVMVDVLDDFTIDPDKLRNAITPRTKAIISVDIAGWPCDYDSINAILHAPEIKSQFTSANEVQATFGRPVLISDAAHSLGAMYQGKAAACASDITIFSLHAVKNVTTAEGGAICLNLPAPFDNEEIYKWLRLNALNGQTKDAFTKSQGGGWRYDIVSDGLKVNMPDICAAIGVAQLKKYESQLMPERKRVFEHYLSFFNMKNWAIIPAFEDADRTSSYHLFLLRIKNITETQRDTIIKKLADKDIATNVHFIPMPMLTLFKNMGYDINDYPRSYANYTCEISLPVYPQLTNEECVYLEDALEQAYNEVINDATI